MNKKKIIKKIMKKSSFAEQNPEYLNDREIVLGLVKLGYSFDNLPNKEFLNDKEVVMAVVEQDPQFIKSKYFPKDMFEDKDVLLAAIRKEERVLLVDDVMESQLYKSSSFWEEAIKVNPAANRYFSVYGPGVVEAEQKASVENSYDQSSMNNSQMTDEIANLLQKENVKEEILPLYEAVTGKFQDRDIVEVAREYNEDLKKVNNPDTDNETRTSIMNNLLAIDLIRNENKLEETREFFAKKGINFKNNVELAKHCVKEVNNVLTVNKELANGDYEHHPFYEALDKILNNEVELVKGNDEAFEEEKRAFIEELNSLPEFSFKLGNGDLVRDSLGKFRDDEDVLRAAMRVDPNAMYGASTRLRSDVKFMNEAVDITKGVTYQYNLLEGEEKEKLAIKSAKLLIEEPRAGDFEIPGFDDIFEKIYNDKESYNGLKETMNSQLEKYKDAGRQRFVQNIENKIKRLDWYEQRLIEKQEEQKKEIKVDLEKQMMDKYGFNCDYIAEGPYHASLERVLNLPRKKYKELTREEKDHILGEYNMIGGTFTLFEKEDGELGVVIQKEEDKEKGISKEEFIKQLNALPEDSLMLKNGDLVRDSLREFSDDEDVLRAALRVDPLALYGASKRIRSDVKFMNEAVDITKGYAYQYNLLEGEEKEKLAIKSVKLLIEEPDEKSFEIPGFADIFGKIYDDKELFNGFKETLNSQLDKYTKEGNSEYVENIKRKISRLEYHEEIFAKKQEEKIVQKEPERKTEKVKQEEPAVSETKKTAYSSEKKKALKVVSEYGRALRSLSANMRDDEDVVLAAVKNDPSAREFASERLQKLLAGEVKQKTQVNHKQEPAGKKGTLPATDKPLNAKVEESKIEAKEKTKRKSRKMKGNYDSAPEEVKLAYDGIMKKSFTKLLNSLENEEIAYLNAVFKDKCKDINPQNMTPEDGAIFAYYTKINNRYNKLVKLNKQVIEETQDEEQKNKAMEKIAKMK